MVNFPGVLYPGYYRKGENMKKILDLSHWNKVINWCDVKNECDGIILKCGGSDTSDRHTYQDIKFEEYYEQCKAHKIPVGAYFFSKGSGSIQGMTDATRCYEIIKGKQFDYPIYCDYEVGDKTRKYDNTMYVNGFVNTLEDLGYWVGVYGSDINTFKDMIDLEIIGDKALWVARYGTKPTYVKSYGMWQKSSTGKIKGIEGNVDMSECTVDYPYYIKKKGLNGYGS